MAQEQAKRDGNFVTVMLLESSTNPGTTINAKGDETTGRLLVDNATAGTVTSISQGTGILLSTNPLVATGSVSLATSLQPMVTLTGNALKVLRVNAGETALEYATISAGLTIGTTTITSGTTTRILYDNAGVLGEYTIAGSGTVVAMATAPTFVTSITTPSVLATANDSGAIGASGTAFSDLFLASGAVINFNAANMTITHAAGSLTFAGGNILGLGATTATSFNGLTITSSTGTFTLTNAKTLAVTNTLTLSGTDSTVMTFPSTTATIARTDAGQTFTGVQVMTSPSLTSPKIITNIVDTNGNELLVVTATASAVNEITLANGATANNPKLTASGGDTNIGFDFQAKGTGTYRLLGTADQAAELRLYEDTTDGTNYTAFKVGTQAADITYTLPTDDGDSGQVLSTNGSGVLDWITAGGGSAWTLLSYSTATASSITVSGLNLTTNNNHYHIIVDMLYSTVSERVVMRSQINAVTTADTYGTARTGRSMDFSAGTGADNGGVTKGAHWQFNSIGGNSAHMELYLYASEADDGTNRVAGSYKCTATYQDISQPDFTINDGAVVQTSETNVTSIKFLTDGSENKVWRVWVLYPAVA